MTRFFGSLISLPDHEITTKNVSAKRTAVTSSISVNSKNTGGSILSYLWQTTGNACTIDTPSSSSTRVTGRGVSGKTQLFCKILNPVTGVTISSPICIITWDPPTLINSVTWSNNSATTSTYNGAAQSPTVVSIVPTSATYSTSTISATNAGGVASTTITGTLDHEGTFTSPNLTIVPSIINISAVNTTSFSYNGLSKTLGYNVNGVYDADQNYAVSGITYTHAGNYTATLTTTSNNYVLGTSSIPWSISKALLTITTNNASMTYGSSVPTQTFGYTLSGLLGTDTANVITGLNGISVGSATHSTTGTPSSNVGTYPITTNVSGLSATNYTFSAVNGTLTINAATLTASTRSGSATYTGSQQSVTVISGINGTFTGSTSVAGINVGAYTTTITGTGNYTGTVTGTLTINPATLTASTTSNSTTYNGSSQSVSVLSGINGTHSGSTSISGTNAGNYTTTITGTGNYTGTVTGTLTINPASLSASNRTGSATYNGSSQSVTVLSGINGTYSGSPNVSGTNAGSYSTTITGSGNYTGSVTGTLTIHPAAASSSPVSGITTYQVYDGTTKSASVFSGLGGLSYSGNHIASGVNAGTYSSTVTLGGNYSGSLTGYLVISPAVGDISLYFGGYVPAGDTNTKLFSSYLQRANASYTWSHSVSGPGAGDAYVQPGYGVQSTSYATSGFVVTITATISDPNYSASSATTSITFEAYVAPPSGGDGYGGEGGFVSE
jgi:hypothetical protein